MPTISLTDAQGKYPSQSLSVEGNVQSANYEKLEQSLDILQDDKKRALVLDGEGVAVKLTADVIQGGSYQFVVQEKGDIEMDAQNSKWQSLPDLDERASVLRTKFDTSRQRNAAMNAYLKHSTVDDTVMFPDANKNVRDAYVGGTQSQVPAEYLARSDNSTRVAGLPHEPTQGELENFKSAQLRWAFGLGLASQGKRENFLPTPLELREAHRRGKEAVCIRLSDQDFTRVDLETFKLCSVPTEFAHYEGGANLSEKDTVSKRQALRTTFLAGVEDAWNARKANCVTQVKSSDRVSDSPSMQDAFMRGVSAAKLLQSSAPGCTFAVGSDFRVTLAGDSESKYQSECTAFAKGLDNQWESQQNGATAPRADALYPDTSQEERDAYAVGVTERRALEKEKDEIRRAEEAEKENEVEEVSLIREYCGFCWDFKNACCPMTTTDQDGRTLLCGTSLGDWTIILFLFTIYYLYLAMWMWAFIEVMMVVAEPQRPH